jgi:hypothetical protein
MEKCREFNLPYNKYDTMGEAVASHFRIMKALGQSQVVQKKKEHMQAA